MIVLLFLIQKIAPSYSNSPSAHGICNLHPSCHQNHYLGHHQSQQIELAILDLQSPSKLYPKPSPPSVLISHHRPSLPLLHCSTLIIFLQHPSLPPASKYVFNHCFRPAIPSHQKPGHRLRPTQVRSPRTLSQGESERQGGLRDRGERGEACGTTG
jgi:hypothetical protein